MLRTIATACLAFSLTVTSGCGGGSNFAPGGGVGGGGTGGGANGGTASAVPVLDSTSPSTATAGGVGFSLAVSGKNFVSGSVVTWNGSARPTMFFDQSLLFASISSSDIAAPGTANVAVMNPSPSGGTSTSVTFSITALRLNTIAPGSMQAGGPGFMLAVNGKGFESGATVHFGGKQLTTAFVNAGQLTAQIAASEIANPGVVEISVENPAPSNEFSNRVLFASTTAGIGVTQRLSVASDGSQANKDSAGASMSANGRFVAFASQATNLANGKSGVFIRDICFGLLSGCTPTTTALPVTNIAQGSDTGTTSINADGRFVAFGPNSDGDIFLWDTCLGVGSGCMPSITNVSSNKGTSDVSYSPIVNATGRYIAFTTVNFIDSGPAAGFSKSGAVFVRDTCQGAGSECTPSTNQVSFDETGAALGSAFVAGISADGRYVAFVQGEDGGGNAVFVRDTCAGAVSCTPASARVSFDPTGSPFPGVGTASLSANGRFVTFAGFEVQANRLGLFVRDTCLGAPSGCTSSTTRVSVDSTGAPFVSDSQNPSVSTDGRFVTFELGGFDPFDSAWHLQIVVHDTCAGAAGCTPVTLLVSQPADGTPPNGRSFGAFISMGGSFVIFTSAASNLVAGDTNGALDIFLARTGVGMGN